MGCMCEFKFGVSVGALVAIRLYSTHGRGSHVNLEYRALVALLFVGCKSAYVWVERYFTSTKNVAVAFFFRIDAVHESGVSVTQE